LTASAHFAVSSAISLAKSAGVPGITVVPRALRRAAMAGSASATLICAPAAHRGRLRGTVKVGIRHA
jgi:hypothetical protein